MSKSLKGLPKEGPYFDASKIKTPSMLYVCWIDVMGSGSRMRLSTAQAANFVMKLHVAALEIIQSCQEIELWPVMDGLYACAAESKQILSFLRELFSTMAQTFIAEKDDMLKFCIRAGLAYGPIVRGMDVVDCSDVLSRNRDYCQRVLLGITVFQAYKVARTAARFGIALHESTRAFSPPENQVLSGSHYMWWRGPDLAESLVESLEKYHKWCSKHAATIMYEASRIEAHEKLVQDYFT